MEQYIFHIGRLGTICLAELLSFYSEEEVIDFDENYVLIHTDVQINKPQDFLNLLGGTSKISQVITELQSFEDISNLISEYLIEHYSHNNKIVFGFNNTIRSKNTSINVVKILTDVKKLLKKAGLSSRFVNKGSQRIPVPIFFKEKLGTDEACEFNLIEIKGKSYLTSSLASQDIDAYSKRDFDKPFRDARNGMLPPKLAQIMINLGLKNSPNAKTIIDPFCGSGTVLMEALLANKGTIGMDFSLKQCEGAHINLNWLNKNWPETSEDWSVYQEQAEEFFIEDQIAKDAIIVTEGYLGPPQSHTPQPRQIQQIENEILTIHQNFFNEASKIGIKTIVITLPAFKDGRDHILLEGLEKVLERSGYRIEAPFSDDFQKSHKSLFLTGLKTMIYERKDQIVAREILILTR